MPKCKSSQNLTPVGKIRALFAPAFALASGLERREVPRRDGFPSLAVAEIRTLMAGTGRHAPAEDQEVQEGAGPCLLPVPSRLMKNATPCWLGENGSEWYQLDQPSSSSELNGL